jgi:hypothetical protein
MPARYQQIKQAASWAGYAGAGPASRKVLLRYLYGDEIPPCYCWAAESSFLSSPAHPPARLDVMYYIMYNIFICSHYAEVLGAKAPSVIQSS